MTSSSAMPYAFFLDTISSYTNTPNGSVIIGETNLAGQKEINDSKRFFGMSAAFNGGGDAAATLGLINKQLNTISKLSGNAKASAIVNAALRPLSCTIAQLCFPHMVPNSARPNVSQFSLGRAGLRQISSL